MTTNSDHPEAGLQKDDLSCRELVEIVTDYFEGALPPGEVARVELHLRGCPGCSTYVEQLRETIRLTGRLREEDLHPEVRDALLAAFRGWKRAGLEPGSPG